MPYDNARFGTHAEYPADLFAQARFSDSGDGVTLSNGSGATLKIYGFWNTLDQAPRNYAAFLRRSDPSRYARLAYRLVKPRLLVLSGTSDGRTFYERYAFGDKSGAVHAMIVEYPTSRQTAYEPLIGRMSRSLTWQTPAR